MLGVSCLIFIDQTKLGKLLEDIGNAYLAGIVLLKSVNDAYQCVTNWRNDPRIAMNIIGSTNDGLSLAQSACATNNKNAYLTRAPACNHMICTQGTGTQIIWMSQIYNSDYTKWNSSEPYPHWNWWSIQWLLWQQSWVLVLYTGPARKGRNHRYMGFAKQLVNMYFNTFLLETSVNRNKFWISLAMQE